VVPLLNKKLNEERGSKNGEYHRWLYLFCEACCHFNDTWLHKSGYELSAVSEEENKKGQGTHM
jgi:hypothetical protein